MTVNIEILRFEIQLNKLDNSQMVLSPLVVGELLDRLETAEKERDALRAETKNLREGLKRMCLDEDAAAKESAALQAKIAEMERQQPIGEMLEVSPHNYELRWYRPVPFGAKLYTLPGAKGE